MTDAETTEPRGGLVRLTVNITDRAHNALAETADRLGDTRTDTVSRALIIYGEIAALKPGQSLAFDRSDGERVQLRREAGK